MNRKPDLGVSPADARSLTSPSSSVSVTQQFNTTTSMGRLTLNVLLSFAQFEREVTSERIRDKIAASKRNGLWLGGIARSDTRRGRSRRTVFAVWGALMGVPNAYCFSVLL
jgi:resolvase-like protein